MRIRIRLRFWSVIFAAVMFGIPAVAWADNPTPQFCIVPLKAAAAGVGEEKEGQVIRHTGYAFHRPGMPAPVFVSRFDPAWTINADRRAVLYTKPDAPFEWTREGQIKVTNPGLIVDGSAFQSDVLGRRITYEESWFHGSR